MHKKIGFIVCDDAEAALNKALSMTAPDPEIVVLHQGSELLPIITK